MEDFSVFVETRAPEGQQISRPEDLGGVLSDAVAPYRGLCSVGEDGWEARVSVDAEDAVEAGAVGGQLVRSLAARAGMPAWPIVRVDAMRDDVLDQQNSRPRGTA